MEIKEKVVCKRCSHFVTPGEWDFGGERCSHLSCFEGTGYDPRTGKEILRRVADYPSKNRNLDCPDFKKKWFLF